MGASFNTMKVPAEKTRAEVKEAFEKEQDQDRYENGHSYSGGFGMASGLTFEDKREPFTSEDGAYEFLEQHCEKWREAIAVRVKEGDKAYWLIGAWCAS